ncbi:MAG: SufE family protein [Planctomycetaceae bacterium]|jgi:cysteine desulfuration protein SufE
MFDLQNITYPQLVEEFRALGDRDAELELLLELGDSLPEFPQADKTEENRIHGCLSQAWVVPELDGVAQSAPVLKLRAGSDSQIVSGLIAVLLVLFRERAVGEAATLDARAALAQIGLERHLSPQRRNGLYGLLKRIQGFARMAHAAVQSQAQ